MKPALSFFALLAVLMLSALPLRAELQFSIYGGLNSNFDSDVTTKKGAVNNTRTVGWQRKSFDLPPYWGARGTYWFENRKAGWGLAVDYTHAKAYGDVNFKTDPTYRILEFTDGLNLLIFTPMYRFTDFSKSRFVPYAGAGLGLSIPHVEVGLKAFPSTTTLEYDIAGLAAQVLAGMEMRVTDDISAFAEGKLSYANIEAGLEHGGSVSTEIWSPQLAVGLSYHL